jgi:regulation of enolase protein 1 (concanavalin A-like superfamily)
MNIQLAQFNFKIFFKTILISMLLLINPSAWAAVSEGDILTTTVEFSPASGPLGFFSENPYSAVWHFKNSTYFVWVDAQFRPWVSQTTDGTTIQVPLDIGPDYKAQADGHHRFALGVDKLGFIHVTGDMHNYTDGTISAASTYVPRYQKQKILYWKSKLPENIAAGFSFAGGLKSSTAMPGGGWMIGRFFTDNNGELYYSSSVHAYHSNNNRGYQSVGLYKYNPTTVDTINKTTGSWTSIGGLAPVNPPYLTHHFPVFFWELSGLASDLKFQNYQANFKFDRYNNLHFAVSSNTNSNAYGANRLLYAMLPNGGTTWQRADGSAITGFPIRGISGLPASADLVAEKNTAPGFGPWVGVIADKNGKVGVGVDGTWYLRDKDTNKWALNSQFPYSYYGYRLPDNSLIFITTDRGSGNIIRTDSFDSPTYEYKFPSFPWLVDLDENSLKTSGVVYGVGLNKTYVMYQGKIRRMPTSQGVLKTTIQKEPIPAMAGKNIALLPAEVAGTFQIVPDRSDPTKLVNVTQNYGTSIEGVNDSFYYLYVPLKNDRVVTARVWTAANGYSRAGIMMRETLTPNSAYASIIASPGTGGKGILFSYRAVTGGVAENLVAVPPRIGSTYWLRLERKGNTFTGYSSLDGVTWTATVTKTIPMNANYYIGFPAASYSTTIQTSTFDNVVIE